MVDRLDLEWRELNRSGESLTVFPNHIHYLTYHASHLKPCVSLCLHEIGQNSWTLEPHLIRGGLYNPVLPFIFAAAHPGPAHTSP